MKLLLDGGLFLRQPMPTLIWNFNLYDPSRFGRNPLFHNVIDERLLE